MEGRTLYSVRARDRTRFEFRIEVRGIQARFLRILVCGQRVSLATPAPRPITDLRYVIKIMVGARRSIERVLVSEMF